MPRTPKRHVLRQRPRREPQHLDGFDTQKCHAGRIRLHTEVFAQVPAHTVQRHAFPRATGRVRLTPVSASKTAIFEVSKANSIDCPIAARDAAGTLATNWFSRTLPLRLQLVQLGRVHDGTGGGEVHVFVGSQRFDQVDVHLEVTARCAGGVDQRGIGQMLGPQPDDDVRRLRSAPCTDAGSVTSPNGNLRPDAVGVAGKKFIAGEPMNPATNRLAGRS